MQPERVCRTSLSSAPQWSRNDSSFSTRRGTGPSHIVRPEPSRRRPQIAGWGRITAAPRPAVRDSLPRCRIPRWSKGRSGLTAAREAFSAGMGLNETLGHVDRKGSFAGTMRNNMVQMLDELGMAAALDIPSTAALLAEADQYVHTTSALCYPVFVDAKNYGGANPEVRQSALLRTYVTGTLGPELAAVADAITSVIAVFGVRVRRGVDRCLGCFPWPDQRPGRRDRARRAWRRL
jgi:hypothetical protein